ncbi:ribonuclease E activity regulator RraA [Arthrobacter sp. GCM10027362]|uniref:ribonuclease E activity regulator RraA n=1 Tax=Arthrobacter sp. GCM10027362 TaxID=3273379 RepID=UPI0036273D70
MTDPNARPAATADLYDEHGEELQSLSLQFQDLGGRQAFSGPVRTVRCREDNGLVKSVLNSAGNAAVLVVDGGGLLTTALMGDMIAAAAVEHGWAGVVVHGAVRDREALAGLPLGVKALGTNPRKSAKAGAGEVDAVLRIDGVVIRPGAMLYADRDGILVGY